METSIKQFLEINLLEARRRSSIHWIRNFLRWEEIQILRWSWVVQFSVSKVYVLTSMQNIRNKFKYALTTDWSTHCVCRSINIIYPVTLIQLIKSLASSEYQFFTFWANKNSNILEFHFLLHLNYWNVIRLYFSPNWILTWNESRQ